MGLNDAYDHFRNQVLVMGSLSNCNKAYHMIVHVEKQRGVHVSFTDSTKSSQKV